MLHIKVLYNCEIICKMKIAYLLDLTMKICIHAINVNRVLVIILSTSYAANFFSTERG